MAPKRVLIAYGSRYHTTEKISKKLATYLDVSVMNLRKIPRSSWPILISEKFDGIIVGTGIRVSKWTKETKEFVNASKSSILESSIPFGFFISCGYASDPHHYPIAIKEFLENKFSQIGILPDLFEAFGGVFDFSPTSTYSRVDKRILKWGSRDLVMNVDYSQRNDYIDWNRINEFADKFMAKLTNNH